MLSVDLGWTRLPFQCMLQHDHPAKQEGHLWTSGKQLECRIQDFRDFLVIDFSSCSVCSIMSKDSLPITKFLSPTKFFRLFTWRFCWVPELEKVGNRQMDPSGGIILYSIFRCVIWVSLLIGRSPTNGGFEWLLEANSLQKSSAPEMGTVFFSRASEDCWCHLRCFGFNVVS